MSDTQPLHLVLYVNTYHRTDRTRAVNGAPAGTGAVGIHGYSYEAVEPKVGMGIKKGIATPKGYLEEGKGKGEITLVNYYDKWASFNENGSITSPSLNVRAFIAAMEIAKETGAVSMVLLGPNKYWAHAAAAAPKEWEKAPEGSLEAKARVMFAELTETGCAITSEHLDHVVSKGKITKRRFGVDMVDRILARGVGYLDTAVEDTVTEVSPMKGYYKVTDYVRDRLLSHPYLYYTDPSEAAGMSIDGKQRVYYLGDIRDEEQFLGKPISDATFSVIYLNDRDPVIDLVKAEVRNLAEKALQGLIITDLKAIFSGDLVETILKHKNTLMRLDARTQRVTHFNSTMISSLDPAVLAHELRPIRLGYNAIDLFSAMEENLNKYLQEGRMPHGRIEEGKTYIEFAEGQKETSRFRYLDITSLFYDVTEVKDKEVTKLRKEVTSTFRSVDIDAIYRTVSGGCAIHPITLTLAQDMPDRNTLSALASDSPKMTLMVWHESPTAFRTATILECADGRVGIWSGPYANLWLIANPKP